MALWGCTVVPIHTLWWYTPCRYCHRVYLPLKQLRTNCGLQLVRNDEEWTEVSLGRCCRSGTIGIDFSALLTLSPDWPDFPLVSINTSASTLLWHYTDLPWMLWQSTSKGLLYCLCPANRINPSCPWGQGHIAFSFIAQCNIINYRVSHGRRFKLTLKLQSIVSWRVGFSLS